MKIYAVYKGEQNLIDGTIKECAKFLGVKEETIRFWNSRAYKERIKKYKRSKQPMLAIVIEEEEE